MPTWGNEALFNQTLQQAQEALEFNFSCGDSAAEDLRVKSCDDHLRGSTNQPDEIELGFYSTALCTLEGCQKYHAALESRAVKAQTACKALQRTYPEAAEQLLLKAPVDVDARCKDVASSQAKTNQYDCFHGQHCETVTSTAALCRNITRRLQPGLLSAGEDDVDVTKAAQSLMPLIQSDNPLKRALKFCGFFNNVKSFMINCLKVGAVSLQSPSKACLLSRHKGIPRSSLQLKLGDYTSSLAEILMQEDPFFGSIDEAKKKQKLGLDTVAPEEMINTQYNLNNSGISFGASQLNMSTFATCRKTFNHKRTDFISFLEVLRQGQFPLPPKHFTELLKALEGIEANSQQAQQTIALLVSAHGQKSALRDQLQQQGLCSNSQKTCANAKKNWGTDSLGSCTPIQCLCNPQRSLKSTSYSGADVIACTSSNGSLDETYPLTGNQPTNSGYCPLNSTHAQKCTSTITNSLVGSTLKESALVEHLSSNQENFEKELASALQEFAKVDA